MDQQKKKKNFFHLARIKSENEAQFFYLLVWIPVINKSNDLNNLRSFYRYN